MQLTITNKRGVVDFLWEWAESNGDWSKILIDIIVKTESELSQTDREMVFNYFLQALGLYKGLSSVNIVKPTYKPSNKKTELISLSGVKGVNRLAKNQTINFGKNLTVIFGENGTGKTGYGRILKTLGFSYDPNNTILSNIYGEKQAKSAVINYKVNDIDKVFNWDGTNKSEELGSISMFNNSCVQISLTDRELIVSPMGFHLFSLVITELGELAKLLNTKKESYSTIIPWKNTLSESTLQNTFISQLSGTSSEQTLLEISDFKESDELLIKEKEEILLNLNKPLLDNEVKNLELSINELKVLIAKIQFAQNNFTLGDWSRLKELNVQITNLENRAKLGIKEIAEEKGIKFYQTQEFATFISSAERYIKILGNEQYPNDSDTCVYCLQPIDKSARELLNNYRILLNDKSQEELNQLNKERVQLLSKVSKIEVSLKFHQSTFGIDINSNPIQPSKIIEYNNKLSSYKASFLSDSFKNEFEFSMDYPQYIDFLNSKVTENELLRKSKIELLANLSERETDLKKQISELRDRKLLSGKVEEIKSYIKNYKIISKLNTSASSFNTSSISRKTTQAREELIASNFESIFQNELKAFRKSHIKIDLNFGTGKGQSKVIHKMNEKSLTDILSEGEQKAIALAEFLTELQLDTVKAPVIFDDPVNSLDHFIIDDVARRLLDLSNERQVVIFTHSVLLFNSFLSMSKLPTRKRIDCRFFNSKNEYGETGFIVDAEEEINQIKSYVTKINLILNNTPKDRAESDVAHEGYGHLRSAIEILVEHHIFQGTVKRYQKNIALTQFLKVDGSLLDLHKNKLNEIFERCCGFIFGHSNPEIIVNSPTLIDLEADFQEFNTIKNVFVTK